jgi:hypothetical protein
VDESELYGDGQPATRVPAIHDATVSGDEPEE